MPMLCQIGQYIRISLLPFPHSEMHCERSMDDNMLVGGTGGVHFHGLFCDIDSRQTFSQGDRSG